MIPNFSSMTDQQVIDYYVDYCLEFFGYTPQFSRTREEIINWLTINLSKNPVD